MKLLTFEHEPKSLDEMVLHADLRPVLQNIIDTKPNVLLSGPAGSGKGTFTNIFIKAHGLDKMGDVIKVNCSDETSVENIRGKVKSFATSLSIGEFKLVYLNEMDHLSVNGQAMLRQLMEDVQAFCRFFLLCNYPNKIIPEIFSRVQHVQMVGAPAADIFKHCLHILKAEGVSCDTKEEKEYLIRIIKTYYPDLRRTINALQKSIIGGKLSVRTLVTDNLAFTSIMQCLQKKDLDGIRQALRANTVDYIELYQFMYDNIDKMKNGAAAILLIGQYLNMHSFSALPEINIMTMFADMIMKGAV